MFKRFFTGIIILFAVSLFLWSPVMAVPCAPDLTPVACPDGETCSLCDPPTLPELQGLFVQVLGFIWVMTGLIFFGLFIYNAYLYMFNRIDDAKKRMNQWLIGLLLVLFSQPIMATIMKTMIPAGNTCYDALREPGFTFFFPQVCTQFGTPTP